VRPEDASIFDPDQDFSVLERRLPHWDQPGSFAFVTFRLGDSLPAELARRFSRDRDRLLKEAGEDPALAKRRLETSRPTEMKRRLTPRAASILNWKIFFACDQTLDEMRGKCHLRRRDASKIVADGLLKFDGERYVMAAFVVMPNHVHLLAAFQQSGAMTAQGAAWRKYFARQINPLVGRTGHLWQEDQFDHLVRSEASFDRIRRYIIGNPAKANLRSGEHRLYVSPEW